MEIVEKKDIVCKACRCRFKFGRRDVEIGTTKQREDVGIIIPIYRKTSYRIAYVKCPVCDYKNILYREKV